MNSNYKERYDSLLTEVVSAINRYTGDKLLTLASGEKAVTLYDDYIIVNRPDEPVYRSQSDNRTLELLRRLQSRGETYSGNKDGFTVGYGGLFECDNDTPIRDMLSLEDLISLYDDLYE